MASCSSRHLAATPSGGRSGTGLARTYLALGTLGVLIALASIAGCGSATTVQREASTAPPLLPTPPGTVHVVPSGDETIRVVADSVSFHVDGSGLLIMSLRVTNTNGSARTVAMRGVLLDATGARIGTVSGGSDLVQPGPTSDPIQLNGVPPTGTIASCELSITATASVGTTPLPPLP